MTQCMVRVNDVLIDCFFYRILGYFIPRGSVPFLFSRFSRCFFLAHEPIDYEIFNISLLASNTTPAKSIPGINVSDEVLNTPKSSKTRALPSNASYNERSLNLAERQLLFWSNYNWFIPISLIQAVFANQHPMRMRCDFFFLFEFPLWKIRTKRHRKPNKVSSLQFDELWNLILLWNIFDVFFLWLLLFLSP